MVHLDWLLFGIEILVLRQRVFLARACSQYCMLLCNNAFGLSCSQFKLKSVHCGIYLFLRRFPSAARPVTTNLRTAQQRDGRRVVY